MRFLRFFPFVKTLFSSRPAAKGGVLHDGGVHLSVRSFVRLLPTRCCRPSADWSARAAAAGDERPERCRDTWTTGVACISSLVKNSPVQFILAAGAYSWRP